MGTGARQHPSPEHSARGCEAAHNGKAFAASWINEKRKGMPKQGGKGLFVHSDIISLHLGLISFGIEIFLSYC